MRNTISNEIGRTMPGSVSDNSTKLMPSCLARLGRAPGRHPIGIVRRSSFLPVNGEEFAVVDRRVCAEY